MKFKNKEELAKFTIRYFLKNKKIPQINIKDVPKKFLAKKACFVTIYTDGQLRGCIGNYISDKPLYLNIIENAIRASQLDPRFLPVEEEDLPKMKVEISVLTPLKKYKPRNLESLLKFLEKEKPGVMIGRGVNRALFLPQVWEELPDPQEFLSQLCMKGGLPPDAWRKDTKFWIFYKE